MEKKLQQKEEEVYLEKERDSLRIKADKPFWQEYLDTIKKEKKDKRTVKHADNKNSNFNEYTSKPLVVRIMTDLIKFILLVKGYF